MAFGKPYLIRGGATSEITGERLRTLHQYHEAKIKIGELLHRLFWVKIIERRHRLGARGFHNYVVRPHVALVQRCIEVLALVCQVNESYVRRWRGRGRVAVVRRKIDTRELINDDDS